MEIAITKEVIERLINNTELQRQIPYFKIVHKLLHMKPNCGKCNQRQGIQDQSRLFASVKQNIQLMPKPHLEIIRKSLGADSLVIYTMMANGGSRKVVL